MSAGDKYFQGNPIRLDVSRSKFNMPHSWRGTLNAGEWVPFFTQEVLAGDTFKIDTNVLIRSSTPVAPIMDNATVSVEFFYVPFDLILSRSYMTPSTNDSNRSWRAFFGAQDALLNMPTPGSGQQLPAIQVTSRDRTGQNYLTGGLLDCLGIPPAQGSQLFYPVNALKVLAYYAVWNEYLRDPNLMAPVTYSINGSNYVQFTNNADANIVDGTKSNQPCAPACANHGYFGSALPWPQRNSTSVTLPLGTLAPVIAGDEISTSATHWQSAKPLQMRTIYNGTQTASTTLGVGTGGKVSNSSTPYSGYALADVVTPSNLWADLENATAASINTLRAAFATQRWYEQLARSGNRYDEMIQGMFGVTPPSKGNKPEYLGGKDIPLNIQQVNGTGDNNVGQTGAVSNTFDSGHYVMKSFTEPGIIIGVMCVRTQDSFAQGVEAFDIKRDRFDFYWPQFANIGEVPILKKQLYVSGNNNGNFGATDEEVFGYQEYAADYRYHPDIVTGFFRPDVSGTIASWTYVNSFSSAPTLKSFIQGGARFTVNVDRTLKVSHTTSGYQFFAMVHNMVTAVRPMPLYSIPGLLDHH